MVSLEQNVDWSNLVRSHCVSDSLFGFLLLLSLNGHGVVDEGVELLDVHHLGAGGG